MIFVPPVIFSNLGIEEIIWAAAPIGATSRFQKGLYVPNIFEAFRNFGKFRRHVIRNIVSGPKVR